MAAPTNCVKKVLANPESSTHGGKADVADNARSGSCERGDELRVAKGGNRRRVCRRRNCYLGHYFAPSLT